MGRDGRKSGLVWLALTLAVSAALVAGGRDETGASPAAPPGHEARACGACGAHQALALPFELGADNLRLTGPASRAGDGG